jgi:hypothetical protein
MNEDLKIDGEDEALTALGHDRLKSFIELVSARNSLRPIQLEDGRGNDFRLLDARVDGVLSRPQWFLPDTTVPRSDQAAELELGPGGILGGQANVRLDDRYLTLLDDEHRYLFDLEQEWIDVVGAVEERVVL